MDREGGGTRTRRRVARTLVGLGCALALLTSCTSAEPPSRHPGTSGGGTLRVGLQGSDLASTWCPLLLCGKTFDPQSTTFPDVFELDRCCLVRTLLTYSGASIEDGGTVVRPDLAAELPSVSADGLTWTFHLREGVRYGPPFGDTEIVAGDFIRSFERALSPAGPAVPWGGLLGGYVADAYLRPVIEGAQAFVDGDADHVSGLEAPDDHTLVVHLVRPTGDLPNRVALPGFGPIPANPARPDDAFGVAQGHDWDYGDVIVSTGPYMFEGSEDLDFSLPANDLLPPRGNGTELATFVRNPSWSPSVDPVRTALPDRIEFSFVRDADEATALVRSGALDVVMNAAASPSVTSAWLDDASLRPLVHLAPADAMRYLTVNLAIAPFDDLHVRRAMDLVVDRDAVAAAAGRFEREEPFTHLALDSYEDNLLRTYAPPDIVPEGNVAAARTEMRASRYDHDGDGRCDAGVCTGLELAARAGSPGVAAAKVVAGRLAQIGLGVRVVALDADRFFGIFSDPRSPIPLVMDNWIKDYPNASSFFPVLLTSDTIGNGNRSMIGATPDQLRRFGFGVRSTPNVDDRIGACQTLVYEAQTTCWAQLDQYLMEQIVPWVPLAQVVNGWLGSARISDLPIDPSPPTPLPAIERIRLDGTAPRPEPTSAAPTDVPAIPDGVYRVTITAGDIVAAGGARDDVESVGGYTIVLDGGRFFWHQRGDGPIFNPIAVGRYSVDAANEVTFDVRAPIDAADTFSPLSWEVRGDALAFTLERCTGPAADDAGFCAFQKALFTAHPWERLTDVEPRQSA